MGTFSRFLLAGAVSFLIVLVYVMLGSEMGMWEVPDSFFWSLDFWHQYFPPYPAGPSVGAVFWASMTNVFILTLPIFVVLEQMRRFRRGRV